MQNSWRMLQSVYAISIILFMRFFVMECINVVGIATHASLYVLLPLAITLVVLGLFRYRSGLGFGLIGSGIWFLYEGAFEYWVDLAQGIRFVAALIVLALILYAWFIWSKKK